MGNIMDYIQWRGDLSFAQAPFNEVDNLILSCFAYVDLDGITLVQNGMEAALPEVSEAFFAMHTEEELEADKSFVRFAPYMMRDMARARRFQKCVVRNYVNEIVTEDEQQFSAVEILLEDGSAYVAFRGTDDTIVGWKEDFKLSNGIVPAQKRAAEYLNKIGRETPGMLRVGGHSKGGNLAIYASVACSSEIQRRILEVYSNDGPGFPRELLDKDGVENIQPRLRRIIPECSIIGMLLEHEKEPVIVKSSQKGILQHDGFSWQVTGPSFDRAEVLDRKAAGFSRVLHKWIDSMDAEQRAVLIEELFSVLEASGAELVSQVQDGGIKSFHAMAKRLERFSPESRAMIQELINALFASWMEHLHLEAQENFPMPLFRENP